MWCCFYGNLVKYIADISVDSFSVNLKSKTGQAADYTSRLLVYFKFYLSVDTCWILYNMAIRDDRPSLAMTHMRHHVFIMSHA